MPADRPVADAASGNGRSDGTSSPSTILLVDDDPVVSRALAILFEMAGHRIDLAATPEQALSSLAIEKYDAILLDLNFAAGRTSGDEGLACLRRILADDPRACVIVITAHSGIRIAVAAMQAGARDFVMKPWRNAELLAKVEAAMTQGGGRAPQTMGGALPSEAAAEESGVAALLGESPAMGRVRDLVRRVGPTAAGVAVTGPSGSGRSLVAAALHATGGAAERPIVTIDLRDPQAWRALDGATGTIVLRHVERLDEVAQSRLLGQLSLKARPIAIADDIHNLVPALRRRIATIEIAVAPLRERGRDALLLARHFARLAAIRHGVALPRLTPAAEALVMNASWPDDVCGLALAIERAALLATDGLIDAAALALPAESVIERTVAAPTCALSQTEKAVIATALREHRHNVTKAATALGLSRGALYRRMERYGL